ncbi:pilus assembly protein [Luteimonas deserti]|uniref:Pilus assembly protein n=1 Tax=Luteimonas deserti TaxID=2752306 RepID=A0A7Z0QQ17_9GAMM|nr:PilC/PilY family type IV pilus protein [Luteimonas deserti]NYZ62727.1 pilus assembly protein [Luteimonas deserti]
MKGRTKLLAGATALVLAGSAYFLHSVMAVQGQGTLAQQPLNVQRQIPPAFIMALDDSGSMVWETLNNTRDGVFGWTDNANASGSFYNGATPRGYDSVSHRFYYAFPPYGRGNDAIPPIDAFGFARSPDVNPGYFDPRLDYPSWKQANRTDYATIDPTAAPLDPRPAGSTGKINGTLNLTALAESTVDSWRFRVRPGMILPAGTRVRGTCDANGGNINSANAYVELNSARRITQSCLLHFSYFPATFFMASTTSLPPSYGYTATPVAITNPEGGRPGTLYKYEIRPGNFASQAQYQAALGNFARWFSFYRTRREGLIGGVVNALLDVENMTVGWFRISNRNNVTMRDMSNETAKQALYDEIVRMPAAGSTPNRRAVQHIGEQFRRTDDGRPITLSCQKNAGMLFTDGYINEEGNSPSVGNLDAGMGPPFEDAVADTMADLVMPYYLNSLLPAGHALERNAVPVPPACASVATPLLPEQRSLDCKTHLHMNFYGIVLGTLGEQFGVTYLPSPTDPAKLVPDPYLTPPTWLARQDLTPRAVDEMWHATLNTRGEMINATSPSLITAAMRRVLASVSAGESPAGSIALTGARIGAGSVSVSPFYEARNGGTDWYSTLTAQTVTANPTTGVVTFVDAWEAASRLPAAADRNIWFGTGTGAALFTPANLANLDRLCSNPAPMSLCTASGLAALGGATSTLSLTEAVNYLKGDQTLEVERNPNGKLRFRTNRLGDIVNATPVISAPTDDYGYRSLPAPYGASYSTYMTSKAAADDTNRRRPMVFAGANDGMLHGFDGRTTAAGGIERFAFIPQSVVGHMGNLLYPYDPAAGGDQRFQHRYYVDGPLAVSDAYYGGGWKTVLVGSTGAGAKGTFALNVSGVSRQNGTFAGADRLWEVNDSNTDANIRNNIGHVLGRPVIVPVKTRTAGGAVTIKWRAIFGNGYNSTNGRAVLFLVDIDSATPEITRIEAVESGAPAGSNGLGNIVVLDRFGAAPDGSLTLPGRDGFADTVYAADQKGAIWKFDLRLPNPAWPTQPVFTTLTYTSGAENGTRQPILGGLTAAAGRNGGVMLYFGTGSFSFNNDPVDSTLQSLYGVLDLASGQPTTTLTRANLLGQTIIQSNAGSRTTSANVPGAGSMGWYMDLPERERFVGYPRVESGIVFMPTYAPINAQQCNVDGANWLYGLNSLTGAARLSNVTFDTPTGTSPGPGTGAIPLNTKGTAPVKDVAIFSSPRLAPLPSTATQAEIDAALAAQCSMVVQVAGAPTMYLKRPCGRQSWRQIQ